MNKDFNNILNECNDDRNHFGISLKETFDRRQKRRKEAFNNQNLQDISDYGLSEEEAFYIFAYTGSHSSWINEKLRIGIELDTVCKMEFAKKN